jgi:hypothetical protein
VLPDAVAGELADVPPSARSCDAIAGGEADGAHAAARDLLERSIPGSAR